MKKRYLFIHAFTLTNLLMYQPMLIYAITEADVEAVGKETATGNVLIWFLCAIAFLKISQKIDTFMSSLGVNVGRTGGSMMAELMIAARGVTTAKNINHGGSFRGGSHHSGGQSSSISNASFLSGGLSGAVGRQFTKNAMQGATGQKSNPISRKLFESSAQKGGEFANNVTSAVAKGSINHTGSMKGTQAAQALTSYLNQVDVKDAPSYTNVEIGGGRIMGTETSAEHPNGAAFGMYNTDQYMPPEGNHETITTIDNSTWYKQYAEDTVERTPYMTDKGKIAYNETIIQKLPDMPKRKDRV